CSASAPPPSTTAAPTTTTPRTTTTTATTGAPCTKAALQRKLSPGVTLSALWCAEGWAVVDTTTPDSENTTAYRWNGTTWDVAGQFACGIPIAGLPAALENQVCHR